MDLFVAVDNRGIATEELYKEIVTAKETKIFTDIISLILLIYFSNIIVMFPNDLIKIFKNM